MNEIKQQILENVRKELNINENNEKTKEGERFTFRDYTLLQTRISGKMKERNAELKQRNAEDSVGWTSVRQCGLGGRYARES